MTDHDKTQSGAAILPFKARKGPLKPAFRPAQHAPSQTHMVVGAAWYHGAAIDEARALDDAKTLP